jgi:glyoxylase-like metal-dependent hydrolase (beta-lactamase superfamily II)
MRRLMWRLVPLLAAWLLGACTAAPGGEACGEEAREPVPWRALAPGVWVWPGATAEVSADNRGHVAPTTVVIDGGEAAVIDPGPSRLHGQRVRRSLTCRFGARVRWVVNTHAHAENVLGNAAFADRSVGPGVDIVAAPATAAAMAERCPVCLASLTRRIGERAMAGTRIVLPTREVGAGDVLAVGRLRLVVKSVEQGHTEADLVLWLPGADVLWAGGLVYQGRVPELSQGSLLGWLAALQRLQDLAPRHVVSATGTDAGAVPATRAYLTALRDGVLQAMDQGRQPQEAGLVPLPAYAGWAGYAERHAFNVQRAWREMEPVWMDQGR